MSEDIRVNVARARSAAVGREHGVTPAELREAQSAVRGAHARLRKGRTNGRYGFYDLYKDKKTFQDIKKTAAEFSAGSFENLVILGIGGSALGTTALVTALKPPYYNLLSHEERNGRPRVFVMDNIDPDTFHQMLQLCPPEKTLYNVISKSGGTAETVTQLLIVVDILKKTLGAENLNRHLVVTTGNASRKGPTNPLIVLAERYNLKRFHVPAGVEGRFSVFSPVGMFPAAMLGMDLNALRAGCAAMDKRCNQDDPRKNPAYMRALIHYLGWRRKGKALAVMMPYADGLGGVAAWHAQLWAESLGKHTLHRAPQERAVVGQTPVRAIGATDQHSQLQLYLEGPNDKIITILHVKEFRNTLLIPKPSREMTGLSYLRGASMNSLMAAECRATGDALVEENRPLIQITLPSINEHALAQVLYMLEVETAMAGFLFNVNPFDQPAVERIKVLTREYMRTQKP